MRLTKTERLYEIVHMKKTTNSIINEMRTSFEVQKHQNMVSQEIIEIKYKFKDGSSRRVLTNKDGTFTVINKEKPNVRKK